MPCGRSQVGDALRVGDRQAVDDARCPACCGSCSASQASRSAWSSSTIASSRSESRAQRPAKDRGVSPELVRDVGDDPVVGGRRRREHRHVRASSARGSGRSAGSRAGSRGPSRRCSGPRRRRTGRSSPGSPAGCRVVNRSLARRSGEISRTSIASAARPGWTASHSSRVAGVDRGGAEPEAARHRDLVAHQREQRADDQRRARGRASRRTRVAIQ